MAKDLQIMEELSESHSENSYEENRHVELTAVF